jgi:16S rRNA (cytosine967-C5)-methyltransferase
VTPGARLAAGIAVLDRILGGAAAEEALTNWGRASRYAGSGDRAAVRDLVYDALRCRRSFAALGGGLKGGETGGETGRALILGGLRAAGGDAALFAGTGHAPEVVTAADAGRPPTAAEALDCPDWVIARMVESLGPDAAPVMQALRRRAPVFLRVNSLRGTVAMAVAALAADGIVAGPRPEVKTALEVTGNARKIQTSEAYRSGLVELQDLSSQAVVAALPLRRGMRVLDYCAGGGGKSLALAAGVAGRIDAHDAAPGRMRDLPERARRAGAAVQLVRHPQGAYDLVLADAPCSGSGSWRRDPMGKWTLTPARLAELMAQQAEVLDAAARLVGPGGSLAYATCSLFSEENQGQIAAFLARQPDWQEVSAQVWTPLSGGDGFFLSILTRN